MIGRLLTSPTCLLAVMCCFSKAERCVSNVCLCVAASSAQNNTAVIFGAAAIVAAVLFIVVVVLLVRKRSVPSHNDPPPRPRPFSLLTSSHFC